MNFRKALLKTARAERAAGNITRLQSILIRAASLRPKVLAEIEDLCCDEAEIAGHLAAGDVATEIDWDNLLEFIKELLPIILEFIKMLLPLFI